MAVCLLWGCGENEADRIAEEIEETVVLPTGSESLPAYSRYYANGVNGMIHASYIMHPKDWREIVQRDCAEQGYTGYPCDRADAGVIDAGNRTWVPDKRHLPFANDAGCTFITIEYDTKSGSYLFVECN